MRCLYMHRGGKPYKVDNHDHNTHIFLDLMRRKQTSIFFVLQFFREVCGEDVDENSEPRLPYQRPETKLFVGLRNRRKFYCACICILDNCSAG